MYILTLVIYDYLTIFQTHYLVPSSTQHHLQHYFDRLANKTPIKSDIKTTVINSLVSSALERRNTPIIRWRRPRGDLRGERSGEEERDESGLDDGGARVLSSCWICESCLATCSVCISSCVLTCCVFCFKMFFWVHSIHKFEKVFFFYIFYF